MADPIRTVRELRRAQIVAAARALVAEGGLEALTIGALERRLDFTRGVITYHFRDKDEIVAAVLESAVEEIDSATFAELRGSSSPEDAFRAVIDSKVRGFLEHAEARAILVSFWSRMPGDRRAAELHARLYGGWRKQAAALIRRGQQDGSYRADVAADAVAALLVGIVVGIVVQAAYEPGEIDVSAVVDEASRSIRARLRP